MPLCSLHGGARAFFNHALTRPCRFITTVNTVSVNSAKAAHIALTSSNLGEDRSSYRSPPNTAFAHSITRSSGQIARIDTVDDEYRTRGRPPLNTCKLRRAFSTTTKPFSRKKPAPRAPEIDATTGDIVCEPLLSFNYQATLGIIQIARAVAPIVSMNEGFVLTANYDLRTDGEPTPSHLID